LIKFSTEDGVQLAARHWDLGRRDVGCVVGHGFTGSSASRYVQAICGSLAAAGLGVLAVDFRGHGRSGGVSTAGANEIHDLAAAVRQLRLLGYQRVAVLGWSMGGSVVLRYTGLGGDADAVVSVSSPGMWFERGTRPMRVVHWMCQTRSGRLATRLARRTRLSSAGWPVVPEAPVEVVGSIRVPLLLVHGDADAYFPLRHVEALAEAAPTATLWIERGMGHAETATTPELTARIGRWVRDAVAAVPAQDGVR
jgi:pimeloyl-ACP methyl ester carboxylesterase